MYLGHIISSDGISPDPDKIQAITRFPVPKDKAGLRRYLGMVKFLAQYIPNESTITATLRRLICDNVQWEWQGEQDSTMAAINSLLTSAPALAPSDVSKDVCVQADASLAGLGACLMQDGRSVAYASCALNKCEQRYAQIEKELLAIC